MNDHDRPPPQVRDSSRCRKGVETDDDFEAPESESIRKLVRHIVDEMPVRVIVAIALVAFMFFYGMAANVFKLTGSDLASLDFPLGSVCGLIGSTALTVVILRIKYRRKK